MIIVGGGVIGLSLARQLAGRKSVLLLDRGSTGQGTSRAAAGMLTPLSEADDQGPFFRLCRASHAMYAGFVKDVEAESQVHLGYSAEGLLFVASTDQAAQVLRRRYEWQKNAGFPVELVSEEGVRKMEPLITLPVHTAVFISDESSLAPRLLAKALLAACVNRGVEVRTVAQVDSVGPNCVRIDSEILEADNIVIASGVWSGEISGLQPAIPVHPRKGQILSLGMPAGAFRHMIRWEGSYFSPRKTGELVVGATNEDAGFDLSNTPAGLGRLLMDAQQMSTHVAQYPILETWTGLRPATPDGLPILGKSAVPGVYYATGHYRNGVLLAPITATIVADLIEGRDPAFPIDAYSPARFEK